MKPQPGGSNPVEARPETTLRESPGNSARWRLLDKDASAQYLSTSTDTVERLIHAGQLPVVRLPAERAKDGRGQVGASRRVLLDVRDLDALIEKSKETAR